MDLWMLDGGKKRLSFTDLWEKMQQKPAARFFVIQLLYFCKTVIITLETEAYFKSWQNIEFHII